MNCLFVVLKKNFLFIFQFTKLNISLSQFQAQANEVSHRNATAASVVQIQAETSCVNTSKAYNMRQKKFMVRHSFFFFFVITFNLLQTGLLLQCLL